jgi:hypothetical protein
MIRRSTWITLGGFAVILLAAIWLTRSGVSTSPAETPTPTLEPVWSWTPDQVVDIEVESVGNRSVVRARRDEAAGWVLEQPSAPYADSGRLERAVSSLASMQPSSTLVSDRLVDFGLDPPMYRISVDLEDGSTQVLEIGRQAPTGGLVYAKHPFGEAVLLLQSISVGDATGLFTPLPIATPTSTPTPTVEATAAPPTATPAP